MLNWLKLKLSAEDRVLARSYAVLTLLVALLLVSYFRPLRGKLWIKDLSLALGTNLMAALVIVFLIDRVIRSKERREAERRTVTAFQQLRVPLLRHLHTLFGAYKASVPSRPARNIEQVAELFDASYTAAFGSLDFMKPGPVVPPVTWLDYIIGANERFKAVLDRTIDRYGFVLEAEVVDILQSLIDSEFGAFLSGVRDVGDADLWSHLNETFRTEPIQQMLNEYTVLVVRLTNTYNRHCTPDRQLKIDEALWDEGIAPQVGSGMVEQPPS